MLNNVSAILKLICQSDRLILPQPTKDCPVKALKQELQNIQSKKIYGRVKAVQGVMIEIAGPLAAFGIGARLKIERDQSTPIMVEIVGFKEGAALAMPYGNVEGISMGAKAVLHKSTNFISPCTSWLGRVINALGEPIDGKGPLVNGDEAVPLRNAPPPAHERKRVGEPLDLGVKAMNCFTTCCIGQRLGIFAGSGVGKSVLMAMLTKNAAADVFVIGLIGERGREVQEFIEDNLGEEGLKRTIVVVATSDEAALMRRQAAYMTMSLSEYFRDTGKNVMCMIDSITRFAMAGREIGLSVGEPPATKGYTPTVFAELPRLLERAGPGTDVGSITGLFTVLVEGDDHNEPIADAVRGILDGHIVMERAIAERGRYPAINVLKSISRTMPECVPEEVRPLIYKARAYMSTFYDMEEIIRMGVYRPGSNPETDAAIKYTELLEKFLQQGKGEATTISETYEQLAQILSDT